MISYGFIHYLICRRGPLARLVIFTTTIKVKRRYRANMIVNVPVGRLYNFLKIRNVLVVISSFGKES